MLLLKGPFPDEGQFCSLAVVVEIVGSDGAAQAGIPFTVSLPRAG